MANDAAWSEGWQQGREMSQDRRAHKQALTDEQHEDQREKYIAAGKAYQVQLSSYKNDKGEVIPEYADQYKKVSDLSTQNEYNLGQLYDPIKAPGRLQADWHYLRERIHGIKQPTPTPTQSPAVTLPAFAPAPITTPEMPAYQQTTPGLPSQGGGVTTTVPGVAATTMPGMASAPITMPAVSLPKVTKMPWAAGRVQELKDKAMQKAQKEAKTLEAGAGLSPEQTAESTARGQAALRWGNLRADLAQWDKDHPNAPKDDRDAVASQLYEKYIGTTGKGHWETVTGTIPDPTDPNKRIPVTYFHDTVGNRLANSNGSPLDPEIASGFVPNPKSQSADANKRADYQAYLTKNPDYEQKGGTFEKWTTEQAGLGRNAVASAKPPNRDDRYIAILQKAKQGQPLTPDDIAYKGAYDLWVQTTKVNPGVARMVALNDDRYTWVYDLNDPDKTLKPMRMKDAAKAPIGTPQNIAFKTDTAITRAFTSGAPAQTINYFNTAIEHLNLLKQATEALNNGDVPLFNSIANRYATATGNPAPNNFDTVRNAVSGELSKTFKGTGATDEEIGLISGTINNTQSPDQLYGGIDYDLHLMQGKMQALQGQYEAGKQGKPNFPGAIPSPGAVGGNGAGKFPVKIPGTNKTKYFPTQAAADNFKKEANIP